MLRAIKHPETSIKRSTALISPLELFAPVRSRLQALSSCTNGLFLVRGEDPFAGSCDTSVLGNIADSITDSQTTALIIGLCVALGCAAIIIVVSIVMAKKLRRVSLRVSS